MEQRICVVTCDGGFFRYNKGERIVLSKEKAEQYAARRPALVRILSDDEAKAYLTPPVHKMSIGGSRKAE